MSTSTRRPSSTLWTSPASSGSAPPDAATDDRVEIAYLPGGAVAMRSAASPETVLRYTKGEWDAFVLGARDGEFDLQPPGGS
jgi:hypothetical protein